ncbi:MAG: hypothetical protein JSU93_05940 [Methanobacteriota archaeon]|nr:MAG: hypothetical protein JSU93_05940 [Euryarchaeota archaeon]
MSAPCDEPTHSPFRAAVIACVLALMLPLLALDSVAEIPHENYDLIDPDLDLVVVMLNASIRASEDALRSFYVQDTESARKFIAVASSVVAPAAVLLRDIDEVSPSYEQLSVLIPPFSSLDDGMRAFAESEDRMLAIKEEVEAIASEGNISDDEAIAVIDSMQELNIVLSDMNSTIEAMLISANEIGSLEVADRHPFVPNELAELVERLRELIFSTHDEIAVLIEEGIPWQNDESYLLFWVVDADLYLGETLRGGGYLIRNGTFIGGSTVNVFFDGSAIAQAYTDADGSFAFDHAIPVNASWVGAHDVNSSARLDGEVITSKKILVTVSLVPTMMSLRLSNSTISQSDELRVEAVLTREPNLPMPGFECILTVGETFIDFTTDADGTSVWTWKGSELGLGTHVLSAMFPETLPYAFCESDYETVVVDVPTTLTLNLFSDRLGPGDYLMGDGELRADLPSLPGEQWITLSVDGTVITNVTTDPAGVFAFSIETEDMDIGAHVLTARFIDRDPYWRSSEDSARFSIIGPSYSDYPFLPWIPGWDVGGGLQEQIPYLFFGEYAYVTWLFIILVVGIVIKALQVRGKRLAPRSVLESIAAKGTEAPASRNGKISPSPERMPDWLVSPNDKVIWHYHNLMAYLKGDFRIGISNNMTHWEVASLIESLGYPRGDAAKVALIFERAQYSGSVSSEDDVRQMNSSSLNIRRSGGVRPAH